MANNSSIEWTNATWNPISGCSKVSPGCHNCYAERMAKRLQAMGLHAYRDGFAVTLQHDALEIPVHWRKPRMIFVNSMGDLFHKKVPDRYIHKVFSVMKNANQHIFQILTKRDARLTEFSSKVDWPNNVWMGVSVETKDYYSRIDSLRRSGAKIKFLSLEPLLGDLPNLNLQEIDWVIAGGESGPGARLMDIDWVRSIRDQCIAQNVPFFFKQWGGIFKKRNGRLLDGKTWDQMPNINP